MWLVGELTTAKLPLYHKHRAQYVETIRHWLHVTTHTLDCHHNMLT